MTSERERRGVPAAPGIAIGPCYVVRRERLVVPEYRIEAPQAGVEIERLEQAFLRTRDRLGEIRKDMSDVGLVGDIFDAQFLFLEDPSLLSNASRRIRETLVNAEWALQRELRQLESVFESMPDPYIRERSSDIAFVVRRVHQELMGREPEGLQNAPPGVIVVAEDISPAEVAQLRRGQIAAFVTETGSQTSHVTIMARSLEIPAVVGLGTRLLNELADDGHPMIVDGRAGIVIVDPTPERLEEYQARRDQHARLGRELLRYVDLPAETRDGVTVRLLANVDQQDEIEDALHYGAEGIGLFRTEYLFMNRSDLPSEEEQLTEYRQILEAVAPHSAVIRTLDIGGEKVPSGLDLADEPNPALGLRGVRMSYARPELFRAQLRALLAASAFGQLKVLVPMVSSLVEVQFARDQLRKARAELEREGVKVSDSVDLGVMIETPAAAMIADLIAPFADFLSIGTNDLLQYTLAVDRENEHVAYLYEPLHPAVLRLIQRVCQAGRRGGIAVAMCGEMAGDPLHSWILLALGVSELSMTPYAIPLLRKLVRESTVAEARQLLGDVLPLQSGAEVRSRVEEEMRRRFPGELEG